MASLPPGGLVLDRPIPALAAALSTLAVLPVLVDSARAALRALLQVGWPTSGLALLVISSAVVSSAIVGLWFAAHDARGQQHRELTAMQVQPGLSEKRRWTA